MRQDGKWSPADRRRLVLARAKARRKGSHPKCTLVTGGPGSQGPQPVTGSGHERFSVGAVRPGVPGITPNVDAVLRKRQAELIEQARAIAEVRGARAEINAALEAIQEREIALGLRAAPAPRAPRVKRVRTAIGTTEIVGTVIHGKIDEATGIRKVSRELVDVDLRQGPAVRLSDVGRADYGTN